MTDLMKTSLFLRIASALVLMPIVLFAMIYGSWLFWVMMAAVAGISLMEWMKMARASSRFLLHVVLGGAYILFCLACFAYIRMGYIEGGYALCLLFCIWASDTGAYFAGKIFGGAKMAPAVSPNKTWAGLVGGMVASGAMFIFYTNHAGVFLSEVTREFLFITPDGAPFTLFILGAFITIVGQLGDLLISGEKRAVGVKDTGNLIPGHGGLLDRIDSLLLASPVFLLGLKVLVP